MRMRKIAWIVVGIAVAIVPFMLFFPLPEEGREVTVPIPAAYFSTPPEQREQLEKAWKAGEKTVEIVDIIGFKRLEPDTCQMIITWDNNFGYPWIIIHYLGRKGGYQDGHLLHTSQWVSSQKGMKIGHNIQDVLFSPEQGVAQAQLTWSWAGSILSIVASAFVGGFAGFFVSGRLFC